MNYNFTTHPKKASQNTKKAQDNVYAYLDFDNTEDFELAKKGLLLQKESLTIAGAHANQAVWDLESYNFLKNPCPETVNPSLWRISQLNIIHGLFEVLPGIYQVRGYDIAYITFIKGDSGWICVDPITSTETSRAAKELLDEHFGPCPISAVLYTHGHNDHFAGAKGVISEEDVKSGRIKIYAPQHFLESAVSENVYAGQAMGRRAMYVYGSFLPRSPQGNVGNGIGMTSPLGTSSLIAPTDYISEDQLVTIDGISFQFIMAPGTEAPAEFMFYLPQFKALCTAELTNASLHNIYTIRGAEIRDAKAWAYGIDGLIESFAESTEVVFMTHHWPRWGNAKCREYLENQRDLYKYLHDQTLNLANQGFTPDEIGEMVVPPKEIDSKWYSRGYHGTLSHNARGIFQKYLGFWDGNPCNLNKLPTSKSGKMFVEIMGGKEAVVEKAVGYFEQGEYRFVAEVLNNVVFAYPDYMDARLLLADTLEQLGYQAENGTWRNSYLTGAFELRHMSPSYFPEKYPKFNCFTEQSISGLTIPMMLEYLAIRLDIEKAAGKQLALNLNITDCDEKYEVELKNCVLNFRETKQFKNDYPTISISHDALGRLALLAPDCRVEDLTCTIERNREVFKEFIRMFEQFSFWFNIIEA
ncbi:MAG: alkyl sulfatase dimerization domain-containing protein [Angelakisella sp.]